MTNRRSNNKKDDQKSKSFHLIGNNKNDLKITLYGEGKREKKSSYTKFFALILINGIQISGFAYLADDDSKEDDKNSFFAMPSHYNESKDEYIKQVSIKDDGIKEDIDQLMELVDEGMNV